MRTAIARRMAHSKQTAPHSHAMTATLSADHRAVDGADAGRFLDRFRALLEAPAR